MLAPGLFCWSGSSPDALSLDDFGVLAAGVKAPLRSPVRVANAIPFQMIGRS